MYGISNYYHGIQTRGLLAQNKKLETQLNEVRLNGNGDKIRLEALEKANRQMSERLHSSTDIQVEEKVLPEPIAEQPQRDRQAEMKAFAERALQRSLERWQGKLKLRPDQVARLNQLLQARMQNAQGGRLSPSELEQELLQVLTAEQKAEYDRIQNREAQARLELRTNTGLSQVQSMFDLTDAQKDQVFQKFAALEQSAPSSSSGERSSRQEQNQKRVEALKGILTPEQLAEYAESLNRGSARAGFQGR